MAFLPGAVGDDADFTEAHSIQLKYAFGSQPITFFNQLLLLQMNRPLNNCVSYPFKEKERKHETQKIPHK